MKKVIYLLVLSCLIIAGCQSVSQQEAITITQDFVNDRVKFYVNEDEEGGVVQRASINIDNVEKLNNIWNVYLSVLSNQTGEIKSTQILVLVDAKTGEVKGMENIK